LIKDVSKDRKKKIIGENQKSESEQTSANTLISVQLKPILAVTVNKFIIGDRKKIKTSHEIPSKERRTKKVCLINIASHKAMLVITK
jgi:hypothetical protein